MIHYHPIIAFLKNRLCVLIFFFLIEVAFCAERNGINTDSFSKKDNTCGLATFKLIQIVLDVF